MRKRTLHRHHPGYKDADPCPACEADKGFASAQRYLVEGFKGLLAIDPNRLEYEDRIRHKRVLARVKKALTIASGPAIVERLTRKYIRMPSTRLM